MKKKTKNFWLTILEIIIALALVGVVGYLAVGFLGAMFYSAWLEGAYNDGGLNEIKRRLDLTFTDGVLIEYTNSHDSLMGDGLTYICVDVSASSLSVEGTHGWDELPMSENIHTVLYGSETHGALKESFEFALPDSENGYYYFYNKQSDSYTDDGLLGQASYNFKFALYDTDEMKLYFIEFDT